jgi:hypothetical protein
MRSGSVDARPKGRLEAFSDGVFAIAITLLVLEIAVPAVSGDRLLRELLHEWPIFLGHFLAFMMIGVRWMEHGELVDALPTRLMADYAGDVAGERVAVVAFGLVLLLQSLTPWVLARQAERYGLFVAEAGEEEAEEARVCYQVAPSLVLCGVASAVGLAGPRTAIFLYLVIAVYLAVPLQALRRLTGRGGGR